MIYFLPFIAVLLWANLYNIFNTRKCAQNAFYKQQSHRQFDGLPCILCVYRTKVSKLRSQFSGHTTKMLPHAALFIQFKIKVLLTIFFIVRILCGLLYGVNISQFSYRILSFHYFDLFFWFYITKLIHHFNKRYIIVYN